MINDDSMKLNVFNKQEQFLFLRQILPFLKRIHKFYLQFRDQEYSKFLIYLLLFFFLINCKYKPIQSEIIPIHVASTTGYAPIWVAKNKNIFSKYNIPIEIVPQSEDETRINQNPKIICMEFSDAIMYNSESKHIKIIYRLNYNSNHDLFISRNSIQSIKDLKYKKVGFNGINSSSHLFVRLSLQQAGITEGKFLGKNLSNEKIIESIQNGSIDAGHLQLREYGKLDPSKFRILAQSGDVPDFLTNVIAVDSQFLSENQETVKQIVLAIEDAVQYMKSNPEETAKILSQEWNVDVNDLKKELKAFYFLSRIENNHSLRKIPKRKAEIYAGSFQNQELINHTETKQGSLFLSGKSIIQFYYSKGQFFIKPNIDSLIESQYIDEGESP